MTDVYEYNTFIKTPESESELNEIIQKNKCDVDSEISTNCTLLINMADSDVYEYNTFIKTPESESELNEIIQKNKCDVDSEISTNCTLIINDNINELTPPLTPPLTPTSNNTESDKNQIKNKLILIDINYINLYSLNSNELLFSDVSDCCYTIYHHYTLNNFIYEHIHIIGLLLNTIKQWIIETINYNINLRKYDSSDIRNLVKLKYKIFYSLIKSNIKNEIVQKNITNLKKPKYWKNHNFLKFIQRYFKMSNIIKLNEFYYIIQNNNSIDGKIIINNDITISCDSYIIGDIYCDILNNIYFSGINALFKCELNKKI